MAVEQSDDAEARDFLQQMGLAETRVAGRSIMEGREVVAPSRSRSRALLVAPSRVGPTSHRSDSVDLHPHVPVLGLYMKRGGEKGGVPHLFANVEQQVHTQEADNVRSVEAEGSQQRP